MADGISMVFQSTLPLRGATYHYAGGRDAIVISIHAPLAGSDASTMETVRHFPISIHAPLAGSDYSQGAGRLQSDNFNPRSPCGERQDSQVVPPSIVGFQSTLPLRGATIAVRLICRYLIYFNPRSPCGERPSASRSSLINIVFQSTLPLRGATNASCGFAENSRISIHAPLAGSDLSSCISDSRLHNFNPRSPCGERPMTTDAECLLYNISIHAPLAGSDHLY